jgi:hypothetical protein
MRNFDRAHVVGPGVSSFHCRVLDFCIPLACFGAIASKSCQRNNNPLGWHAARGLVWFWTIPELGNGIGHSALALSRGGYFPGVVTAPLLLLFAGWLAIIQIRQARQ